MVIHWNRVAKVCPGSLLTVSNSWTVQASTTDWMRTWKMGSGPSSVTHTALIKIPAGIEATLMPVLLWNVQL